MKLSDESRNNYTRGPTQLSTPLYSQLILRICAATNRLSVCLCPRARETLGTSLTAWFVQMAWSTNYVLNGNSNFRLQLHHSILFGAGSTVLVGTNCFWKWITLFLQMQLYSFFLFVFCV